MQKILIGRLPRIAGKRTQSAYKTLYRKAVSVIASVLITAEIALMLCLCAVAAYRSEYLISVAILMIDLGIICALSERTVV